MKTLNLTLLALFASLLSLYASDEKEEAQQQADTLSSADEFTLSSEMLEEMLAYKKYSDSIDKTFTYQYDKIILEDDLAEIDVPEGYKFVDAEQADRILVDLWNNPKQEGTLGMLLKKEDTPVSTSYAIEISYSEEGYVSDEDAEDIDYDDLLEQMIEDTEAANEERVKLGYGSAQLVGWASKPFYDANSKKLHWAKEIKFNNEEINTLNYNIRVLGRKGYINLNVIGDMEVLPDVQTNMDGILGSVHFKEGNRYEDFNSDIDKVAAYGIGGLVAGKLLAKAGFFAILAKYAKVIIFGIIAAFGALRKKIFGSKED